MLFLLIECVFVFVITNVVYVFKDNSKMAYVNYYFTTMDKAFQYGLLRKIVGMIPM